MRLSARTAGAAFIAACALAGVAAAFALVSAGNATPGQTTEPPTTTTTTSPPPTEPPAEPSGPAPIAFGVTVGGVRVGGMLPYQARKAVGHVYAEDLQLVIDDEHAVTLPPAGLGAKANFDKAIRRARFARPGAIVALDVAVSQARVRGYVDHLGDRLDRDARDARIVLQGLRPRAIESQDGRYLKRLATGRSIRTALATNSRLPIRLRYEITKPEVRVAKLDEAIIIMRSSNKLLFFDNAKYVRSFGVATGQSAYPTPLGNFEIANMQRDPWWYPPPSPWAQNEQPVPPGPGNPLGTRWMGLSTPYVGIHGTPDAASIGYSASHGCIRMRIPDAEWLFQHVKIGTPVFIIAK